MKTEVCCVVSTKGGIGKTTLGASVGAISADAGIKTLLIDIDPQPSLSSFYPISNEARGGTYELIAFNETRPEYVISKSEIDNLSIIVSNDPGNQLNNMLLNAADGRLRLFNLVKAFKDDYELILLDTQGARSVLLEMAVLASTKAVSPITPDMLAAREFNRGTRQLLADLQPFANLGMPTPPISIVINQLNETRNARMVHEALISTFAEDSQISVMNSIIPDAVSFKNSATEGVPPHRLEYKRPTGRKTPSALEIIREVAKELFPQWADRYDALTESKVEFLVKGR
ncbi:chromosome partitioning-like protein [Pseudomonas luteola]|uniref:Chromosome partitioning-like protein n=1 Tax=Pseudomonas luteola TaxID=47886 RepID=A0A2X2E6U0_PSELU|nr:MULTISPECIES: ParA family protein [Pseudomonas]SPZ02520.1 chromosome partitioning-like protein [Pseudomonas luteola]